MEVRVLTDYFELSAVLDEIIYLRYTECFSAAGELEMRIPFKTEHYKALKPPSRILIGTSLYTIQRVKSSQGVIEVFARGIFDDFRHDNITKPRSTLGKPSNIIYDMASELSFRGVTYKVYGLSDTGEYEQESFEWCTSYKSIISRLCYENDLGFWIIFDGMSRELKFIITNAGRVDFNSSGGYVVISDKRDGILALERYSDLTDYKNKIEFVYRINALNDYDSIVYRNGGDDEADRTYTENPHIIVDTTEELFKYLDTRSKQIFLSHRKKEGYIVRLNGDPKCKIGDMCVLESDELGESASALLVSTEVIFDGENTYKELILEER